MALPYSFNILERCEVSPPSGSVTPTPLPLTIFDVLWLPLAPVQRLFFFEHHCCKTQFTNTILPDIKQSLSLALQHFFPLAGNLIWPQDSPRPEIQYEDGDSVSFTAAESDYDFDILVRNDPNDAALFYPLVPLLISSPAEKRFPLTSFLVTFFPEKGISIGITYNHVVADGRSILHFIKTWASICQTIQVTGNSNVRNSQLVLQPCISKSLIKEEPVSEIDSAISNYLKITNITRDAFYTSNHQSQLAGTGKVFATFVMGRGEINRLRQLVLASKKENESPSHLSTFVLTCAYVWVCSIKARWWRKSVAVGSEEDQMEYFLFPVDCRARLEPPLPVTYFGNCLRAPLVGDRLTTLMGDQGIPIAAELIGNAILKIDHGNALEKLMEGFLSPINLPPRLLSVAGSTKLGIYDTDFGWGKPKKTHVVSVATTGAICLSECPSEVGAVEISLARNKVEMDAFASLYTSIMQGFPPSNERFT